MRIVADTNTVASGLIWQGSPRRIIDAARAGTITLLTAPISRDPDDDHVLAAALGADAQLIVSGDKDLLVLGTFNGIPILPAAQALEHIGAATRSIP